MFPNVNTPTLIRPPPKQRIREGETKNKISLSQNQIKLCYAQGSFVSLVIDKLYGTVLVYNRGAHTQLNIIHVSVCVQSIEVFNQQASLLTLMLRPDLQNLDLEIWAVWIDRDLQVKLWPSLTFGSM